MSTTELIATYYQYQQFATARILAAAERVPFAQLTVPVLEGFDPVRSALVHTMWAQRLWLDRFMGKPRVPQFQPRDFDSIAAIRARWAEIDADTNAFIASLTDEQLAGPMAYGSLEGGVFTYPLWQAMLHQANHQTYHRGEIAAVLTHLGSSPGEMDVFRMFDGRE